MFKCSCCVPAKSFSYKKTLYKHQRKYDASYEDPRQKADRERRAAYAAEPKRCQTCTVEFSYEDVTSGCKDKYCSRSCAVRSNNRVPKRVKRDRRCAGCTNELPPSCLKFCGPDCQAQHKFVETEQRILAGEVSNRPTLKKYLRKTRGWKCQECDLTEWRGHEVPLELDHEDGDPSNDLPENLRLLCPNCHALQPTSKGRNRGFGRKSRGLLRQ
jgi:hypothetical protein